VSTTEVRGRPLEQRDALLDEVAVTGLDLEAARSQVEQLAGRRRRGTRSLAAAGLLSLLTVAVVAVVLSGGEDPDELVADRDETQERATRPSSTVAPSTTLGTSTTTPPTTSSSTTTSTTAAPAPVPPTVVTTAPPTTATPNRELQARLRVLTPVVAAGATASVEVGWIDEDHPGGAPEVVADWGDPAIRSADVWGTAASCDAPGPGGGGVLRRDFRFATPGRHVVRVELRTCGGRGTHGEAVVVEAPIDVEVPQLGGEDARAIVATVERRPDGLPVLEALDVARARYEPSDPALDPLELGPRTPTLLQYAGRWPATVLVLPADAAGTLELSWGAAVCRPFGPVPPPEDGRVTQVVLSPGC
jgi:hypothetical protein